MRRKWNVFCMGGTALGSINPNFTDPQLHEIVFLSCFLILSHRDDDEDDTSQVEETLPPPSQPAVSLHNPYLDVRTQRPCLLL